MVAAVLSRELRSGWRRGRPHWLRRAYATWLLILTANQTAMPFEVAATAWRHYVGCRTVNAATFDALRDFKIQYRDQAPEHAP